MSREERLEGHRSSQLAHSSVQEVGSHGFILLWTYLRVLINAELYNEPDNEDTE